MNRQSLSDWFPVILKYTGLIVAFVFTPLVWLVTLIVMGHGQVEPLILTAGLTAAGIGEGADAMVQLGKAKQQSQQPTSPPPAAAAPPDNSTPPR